MCSVGLQRPCADDPCRAEIAAVRVVVDDYEPITGRLVDDSPLRPTSVYRSFAVLLFDHLLNLMLG